MKTVRISLKAARYLDALLTVIREKQGFTSEPPGLTRELAAAIAKAERSSKVRRTLAKPKQEKKRSKASLRNEVREAAMVRAGGHCEACDGPFLSLPEMDHFWGRAKAEETLETVWMLDRWCHIQKTRNFPSAREWLVRFVRHCEHHGYTAEAEKARKRLAFVEARGGGA